jgi:predicted GIY-YIG superfamily endonuclease
MASTTYTVYVLERRGCGRTYIGSTNDVRRRVRQHNGELAGGARATCSAGKKGCWGAVLLIEGFCDHRTALQAEWRMKHIRNRRNHLYADLRGAAGKVRGLSELLSTLPRGAAWTSSSRSNVAVSDSGGEAGLVVRVTAGYRGLLDERALARHGVLLDETYLRHGFETNGD